MTNTWDHLTWYLVSIALTHFHGISRLGDLLPVLTNELLSEMTTQIEHAKIVNTWWFILVLNWFITPVISEL